MYFGAGSGTRGGQGNDASEEFRQGLEGTERQSGFPIALYPCLAEMTIVFVIAQESTKQMREWLESSDRPR